MEKQKLAELVLAKMKKKKEEEERNRPHFEVLRLEVNFEKEINDSLKGEIDMLEQLVKKQKNVLGELVVHLQDLDNTGKRTFPRIIVMPDFIASEHIQYDVKEFYRKSSTTFLRSDILRNKNFATSVQKEKEYLQKIEEVGQLQTDIRAKQDQQRKIINDKRVKVLKEDLRLRFIREEQRQIKATIEQERQDNKDLLTEYQIKKLNLDNRKAHLKYVGEQIVQLKNRIQSTYNPVTYRMHLQNIFGIQMKTETMQKHLGEVTKNVTAVERETEKFQRTLEKAASLTVLGKTSDSPSTRKGKIQNRLLAEKGQQSHRRSSSAMSGQIFQQKQRPRSQNSMKQSVVGDLDFSKFGSSAKQSMGTTDRSSHPRYRSQLSRGLF